MPPTSTTTRLLNGSACRAIREAIGAKQGVVATDIKVSHGYYANIEAGRKQPSPDVAQRIAQRLGVPLDAITYVIAQDGAA